MSWQDSSHPGLLDNDSVDEKHGPPEWTFTDAWLLTAIGQFGRQGCSLSAMIGAADALNHDIPTETQTAVSLGRLATSKLIEAHGERNRTTRSGRAIFDQRRGGMFELSGSVLKALMSVPCVEGRASLAPGEFQAAFEQYARR